MKARLTLKVCTRARKTGFTGQYGDAWRLQVCAPPVDGKANEAIVRFLSRLAGMPAASVQIVSGFTGTTKIVELDGIDSERLQRAILESDGYPSHTGSVATPEA